jgi:hypothetical protein
MNNFRSVLKSSSENIINKLLNITYIESIKNQKSNDHNSEKKQVLGEPFFVGFDVHSELSVLDAFLDLLLLQFQLQDQLNYGKYLFQFA